MNRRRVVNNIVQECHDVQTVALDLSHKYNDFAEYNRVIEKDHYKVMVVCGP